MNCSALYVDNLLRIRHFVDRAVALGKSSSEVVILVLHVDDLFGKLLADELLPGTNWQAYRERREVPIARGLANRKGIEAYVIALDPELGAKLQAYNGLAVVVVSRGEIAVFEAPPKLN